MLSGPAKQSLPHLCENKGQRHENLAAVAEQSSFGLNTPVYVHTHPVSKLRCMEMLCQVWVSVLGNKRQNEMQKVLLVEMPWQQGGGGMFPR